MDSSLKSDGFKMIEEQIKDNNVVTFKWLSRKLEIHNSLAKELLQEYLDKSEDKNKYIVTLVVYGKKEQGDLMLSLVKENEFSTLQNTISIIDKHVYSIQPAESTFNPEMIYNLDKATYELKQLSLSSIKYNKEIIRKSKSTPALSTPVAKPETLPPKIEKTTPVVKEKEKVEVKKESPKKESPPNKLNKEVNSKPEAKKSIVKPAPNSKGSISSFFQKQATKAAANKTNSTPKSDSSSNQDSPVPSDSKKDQKHDPSDEEKTQNGVSEAKRIKVESSSKPTKDESPKTNGVSKTLETDKLAKKIEQKAASKKPQTKSKSKKSQSKKATKQKKMKRIILQSDSSSDGEGSDQDSHISEPEPEEEPEPVIESPKKEPPAVIVSHGKKRKRKIIDKTVLDDEGYLQTTKEIVYESCSSDENEEGGANNENIDANKRFKTEENAAAEVKTKAENEEIAKTQTQKTKQASIMSFFKKPSKT